MSQKFQTALLRQTQEAMMQSDQRVAQLLDAAVEAENWLENHGGDPDTDPGLAGLLDMLGAAIVNAKGRKDQL